MSRSRKSLVLIPYIIPEVDAAEVWIHLYPTDVDDLTLARTALADFARDPDAPDRPAPDLEYWRIDRVLLPDRHVPLRWHAVSALDALDGVLEPVII